MNKVWYNKLLKFFLDCSEFNTKKKISRARNRVKLVKVFVNWKSKWYIKLDRLNRNLHIEVKNNNEVDLFSDY